MRLYLFFLLLMAAGVAGARTVTGTVVSDRDSSAVAGAACRLLADGKLLTGVSTDASGNFSLETDARTALTLEVSMTGFTPTEIIIESGAKSLALGRVYLSEGIALGELTVQAASSTERHGRTIVVPSEAELKASATSLALFQKMPLPGLEANPINRTLSVDGGTPMLLINGVPAEISDFNALQPKDIAKVEYSRVTPARYADKGYMGLVSITLKQRTDGGQVYAWGRSAVSTAFVDANIRSSYHQGPSQFTLGYSPSWRNYQSVYDNTTESYIGDDFRVDLEEHDRNPFNYHYHNLNFKYDYSPDTRTLLTATFRINPSNNSNRMIASYIDSQQGNYDSYSKSSNKDLTPSVDVFFRHDFNDKNSLEAQVVGTLSSSDYRRENQYYLTPDVPTDYVVDVKSRRRSLISEVSYVHDFSDNTQLSGGFQNTVSHSRNTYLTTDYRPVLTENNNYVYARLGQQWGPVYMSLSTGAKLFWIKNDMNKRNFVKNLSQAQLSWAIDRKWRVAAAFSYAPGIPSLSSLTDYPQQTSPYLITNGNPDLKVTDNFTFQLMPSFQYKKFSTSILGTYRILNNYVMDETFYLGNGLFLTQSINARRARTAYANLNMRLSDIAGFGVNLNFGVYHYDSSGEGFSHTLNGVDASFTVWWNHGPYTISYWRKIPGKYLSGNYIGKDENGDALSFEYTAGKHWTLGASWMYMFENKGTRYPSWTLSDVHPATRGRYIKNNANMVTLSVTYSADFGSIFRSLKRSLNNSDNSSALLRM